MTDENTGRYQKKIITVPNILSFFRLCLIPVIVWLYCFRNDYLLTTLVLVISGATDVIDGIIARRFGMISDFGKAFDPVADKLTQIVTLFCLVVRFPHMIVPLVVLTVKEVLAAIFNTITIKKTGEVMGAVWHGKLNTVLLYSMMVIHLVWFRIPAVVSDILIVVCTVMMLLSAVLYNMRNARALEQHKEVRQNSQPAV
ncbi:MAG: CDP-alcohol phosphatidyltransferase family protein [Eubacteriales bacterium]